MRTTRYEEVLKELHELVLEDRVEDGYLVLGNALRAGLRDEAIIRLAAKWLLRAGGDRWHAEPKSLTKPRTGNHHAFAMLREERKLRDQGLSAEQALETLAGTSKSRGWGLARPATIKRKVAYARRCEAEDRAEIEYVKRLQREEERS